MIKKIQFQQVENMLTVLLIVALFVLVLDLAISKGMYKICVVFIKVIVSLQLLRFFYLYVTKRAEEITGVTKGLLIAIAIPILVVMLDLCPVEGNSERYYIKNLKTAVFIILAIWMMPFEMKEQNTKLFFYGLLALLLGASSSNFIAYNVYFMRPMGLTSNLHYLALQAIIVIPVAIYLLNKVRLISKVLIAAIIFMELYLLLGSFSRPAWLAFLVSSLVCIPFLGVRTRLWTATLLFLGSFCVYYFGVLNVDTRVNNLISNLAKEERVTIWTDAMAMQQQSNSFQWLMGHGLGSFEPSFQVYSKYHGTVDFTMPHNFFIEVLYTSGLVGCLLIATGEFLFFYSLFRLWRNTTFNSQKALVLLIFILFISHFIHTFLTISLFSRQSIYFLSMFIGLGFYVMKRESLLMRYDNEK